MKTKEPQIKYRYSKKFTDSSDADLLLMLNIDPNTADYVEVSDSVYKEREPDKSYDVKELRWSENILMNMLPETIKLNRQESAQEYKLKIGYDPEIDRNYITYTNGTYTEDFIGDNNVDCCVQAFVFLSNVNQLPKIISPGLINGIPPTFEMTVQSDPKWTHDAAKNIIKYLIRQSLITKKYADDNFLMMYDIVHEIMKAFKNK